jgi:protocatechuate 3,4-dioxygenase beta subunit
MPIDPADNGAFPGMKKRDIDEARRRLLHMMIASPALALAACGGVAAADGSAAPTAPSTAVQPTPACSDGDDEPTPAETEGPYFKPNSPERASLLESGLSGTRLTIHGQVLSTACAPIAIALLDFWQADDGGNYDNGGFRLRGHQFTDASGRFTLETIVPGLYPGRTRHVHVKAQAPNGPVVTTQLYFPGEARNASEGLFMSALLLAIEDQGSAKIATFNFVLRA